MYMKRLIIFFILISFTGCLLFASDENEDSNVAVNVGISTLFLGKSGSYQSVSEDTVILHPLTFTSLAVGLGGHLRIIPHICAPGLYLDMHLSLLSLLVEWLESNDDKTTNNNFPLYIQTGLRLYNQFSFSSVKIQPFYGLNLLGVVAEKNAAHGYKALGMVMAYRNVGLEYSYQIPILHWFNDSAYAIHRIATVIRFSL